MSPNERRLAIIKTLCVRRKETIGHLAEEFGVSERTIRSDIELLSLSYPLVTKAGRYSGGVFVLDGYYLGANYLKKEQQMLLEKLCGSLSGEERQIMRSILADFALPRNSLKK